MLWVPNLPAPTEWKKALKFSQLIRCIFVEQNTIFNTGSVSVTRIDVWNDQKSLIHTHTHHFYPYIKWTLFTVFNFQENNCTEHVQPHAWLYGNLQFFTGGGGNTSFYNPVNMVYKHEWVSMKHLPIMSWNISNRHWALCTVRSEKQGGCSMHFSTPH